MISPTKLIKRRFPSYRVIKNAKSHARYYLKADHLHLRFQSWHRGGNDKVLSSSWYYQEPFMIFQLLGTVIGDQKAQWFTRLPITENRRRTRSFDSPHRNLSSNHYSSLRRPSFTNTIPLTATKKKTSDSFKTKIQAYITLKLLINDVALK